MGIYTTVKILLAVASNRKAQGSIEYIMMLSAVSIIIVIALAMVLQLKGVATHAFFNATNGSITSQLSREISNISKGS